MSAIDPNAGNVYQTVAPIRLEFKENWSDAWQQIAGCIPVRASISTGNDDIGELVFRRKFGRLFHHDESKSAGALPTRARGDLDNWWVRALASPYADADIFWLGKVKAEKRKLHNQDGAYPAGGEQIYTCYDGNDILRRRSIADSQVEFAENSFATVNKMFSMNLSKDDLWQNNRSVNKRTLTTGAQVYCFYGSQNVAAWNDPTESNTPRRWRVDEFLEYLVETFLNSTDTDDPEWTLSIPQISSESILKDVIHSAEFDDFENAFEMLRKVVPKDAGFDFKVWPATDDTGFNISVFSLTDVDVSTTVNGTTETLKKNPDTVSINLTSSVDSESKMMEISHVDQYKTIRLYGDPIIVAASFNTHDDSAIIDWTAAEQAIYDDLTGYTGSTVEEKDDFRALIPNVYRSFKAATDVADWPAKARPTMLDDGTFDFANQKQIQFIERQTLDWLPFYDGGVYTSTTPDLTAARNERLEPFAYFQKKYGRPGNVSSKTEEIGVSVHETQIGVTVDVAVGHELAAESYTPDDSNKQTTIIPKYGDNPVAFTVAFEHDERLRLVHEEAGAAITADGIIDIYLPGNTAHIAAPSTVYDVDYAGNLIATHATDPTILRNDMPNLIQAMNGAKVRYLNARARAVFSIKGFLQWTALLGQILKSVTTDPADDQINGPITSIRWEFEMGYRTTISAGFAK